MGIKTLPEEEGRKVYMPLRTLKAEDYFYVDTIFVSLIIYIILHHGVVR